MITAFTVKNFKAIGEERVRIELKPITLFFGANSAGKSSIIHALNYAYSVFNEYNLNAEYNLHADSSFNLGGFKRFVHDNDLKRSILLKFEINFEADKDIPDECTRESSSYEHAEEDPYSTIDFLMPKRLLEKVDNAYIEVEISWSENKDRPYVSRFETGLMGEWIASISAQDFGDKIFIRQFNVVHPVFRNLWEKYGILMDWLIRTCIKTEFFVYKFSEYQYKRDEQDEICQESPETRSKLLEKNGRIPVSDGTISSNLNITLLRQKDALPTLFYRLKIDKAVWNEHNDHIFQGDGVEMIKVGGPYYPPDKHPHDKYLDDIDDEYNFHKIRKFPKLKQNDATVGSLVIAFQDLLNSILVAPRLKVMSFLQSICHIGPLREIPSRNFLGDLSDQLSHWRWEKGLAAWDKLYQIGQLQLDQLPKLREDIEVLKKEIFKKNFDKICKIFNEDPFACGFDDYVFFGSNPQDEEINNWIEKRSLNDYIERLSSYELSELNQKENALTSLKKEENADEVIKKINEWLSSDQRLNTGYEVFIDKYREISSFFFKKIDEKIAQEDMFKLFKEILKQPETIRIWLRDISRGINLKPHEVGTGVSQVLPVVVVAVSKKQGLLVIEQPELHIHPAMQVQMGDLFIEESSDSKFFLIETHSEHLLLRFLRRIRESAEEQTPDEVKLSPNNVAIYYVESENGNTQVNCIGLDESGRFTDRWPRGFFAERMQEMLPPDIRNRVEAKRRGTP